MARRGDARCREACPPPHRARPRPVRPHQAQRRALALLRQRGLLSQERIELLLSWRRSGFSVHNRVYVLAGDRQGLEALVRYMMRSPVSLSRLRFTPGSPEVVYLRKGGHDELEPTEGERVDAMEFVARVLVQIPDGRRHLARYYGFYSNAARGKRKKAAAPAGPPAQARRPRVPRRLMARTARP